MLTLRTGRAPRGKLSLLLARAALALAGLALTQAASHAVLAQAPAAPTKIAFTRNGQIWTMDEDGKNQAAVTDRSLGAVAEPKWSPDGKKFVLLCGSEPNNVCTYDIASGELVSLTETGDNSGPVWSPDGSKIAFASSRDVFLHVFIMNADGTGQQRLTISDPEIIAEDSPAWSPDGAYIAFRGEREDGEDIYVAKADGSDVPVRLTFSEGGEYAPDWSPDGTRIAYNDAKSLYVIPAAGGAPQLVTGEGDVNGSPSFSPDGRRVAFYRLTYLRDGDGSVVGRVEGIRVADLETGAVTDLNCRGGLSPSWLRAAAQPGPTPSPTPDANHAPVAVARNAELVAGASGLASFSASDIDDGSYDPDQGDTITLAANPAGPFGVGTYVVTLTAIDSHGASSSANATVTVVDRTAPVITSQIIVDPIDAGTACSGVTPDLRALVKATDNVTPAAQLAVSQTPAPGTSLPIGQNYVTLTVTDAAGNRAQIFPLVPVVDRTPPDAFARLEPAGPVGPRSGKFITRFGATDRCDADPDVRGLIYIPANTTSYAVAFQYDPSVTQIDFDVRRRRIILTGADQSAVLQLLSAAWNENGVRVSPGQRVQMLLRANDQPGPNDQRYLYTFVGGQLTAVNAPTLMLRVHASDASLNFTDVTAAPAFR